MDPSVSLENDQDSWNALFERFNQTLKNEAATLLENIKDSQTNMVNERESLRKEIEKLKQERQEMVHVLKRYDQIVTLNVGGQIFSTTAETLTKEECLFTKLLSGRYQLPEQQGGIFIDRDPTHFRRILNYLRTNTLIRPTSTEECTELLMEAEYYQISTLINQLKGDSPQTTPVSVEKLKFDPILHHPQVIISSDGLTASKDSRCLRLVYVKATNIAWKQAQHYWEIILSTKPGVFDTLM